MTSLTWTVNTDDLSAAKVAQLSEALSEATRKVLGSATAPSRRRVMRRRQAEPVQGWTPDLAQDFLDRLRAEGADEQADVIEGAVANGGAIDRASTYEVAGWDPEGRSLKGFTRPINRVVEAMRHEGLLNTDSPRPLEPVYSSTKKGYQRASSFSVPAALVSVFTK